MQPKVSAIGWLTAPTAWQSRRMELPLPFPCSCNLCCTCVYRFQLRFHCTTCDVEIYFITLASLLLLLQISPIARSSAPLRATIICDHNSKSCASHCQNNLNPTKTLTHICHNITRARLILFPSYTWTHADSFANAPQTSEQRPAKDMLP